MIAATESIIDSSTLFLVQTASEIVNSFMNQSGLQLGDSHVEVRLSVAWINLNCCFEVTDSELMVAHVLVHQTSLDVNCLVVIKQLLDTSELLQSFVEALCPAEHKSQMEHRRDISTAPSQSFLEEMDRLIDLVVLQVFVRVGTLRDSFSL